MKDDRIQMWCILCSEPIMTRGEWLTGSDSWHAGETWQQYLLIFNHFPVTFTISHTRWHPKILPKKREKGLYDLTENRQMCKPTDYNMHACNVLRALGWGHNCSLQVQNQVHWRSNWRSGTQVWTVRYNRQLTNYLLHITRMMPRNPLPL